MPPPDRKLTAEDKQKISSYLRSKSALGQCPCCGTSRWVVFDHICLAPLMSVRGYLSSGFPAVIIACDNCSFFRFHSAYAAGVLELPAKPEEAEVNSGE